MNEPTLSRPMSQARDIPHASRLLRLGERAGLDSTDHHRSSEIRSGPTALPSSFLSRRAGTVSGGSGFYGETGRCCGSDALLPRHGLRHYCERDLACLQMRGSGRRHGHSPQITERQRDAHLFSRLASAERYQLCSTRVEARGKVRFEHPATTQPMRATCRTAVSTSANGFTPRIRTGV